MTGRVTVDKVSFPCQTLAVLSVKEESGNETGACMVTCSPILTLAIGH